MSRAELFHAFNNYQTSFREEFQFIPRFKSLINNFPDCFQRSLTSGHITGSAWIVDRLGKEALLVNHKKLNRWLQPGGHADGDEDIMSVATKEAVEETGLKSLRRYGDNIFDIDIHSIPKHKDIISHYHFDIRYLFIADIEEKPTVCDESNELAWIPLSDIHKFVGSNHSIHRMVIKTKLIFN